MKFLVCGVILLEGAIRSEVHCAHKEMDMVNSIQANVQTNVESETESPETGWRIVEATWKFPLELWHQQRIFIQ